jgi:hypothetical protein
MKQTLPNSTSYIRDASPSIALTPVEVPLPGQSVIHSFYFLLLRALRCLLFAQVDGISVGFSLTESKRIAYLFR